LGDSRRNPVGNPFGASGAFFAAPAGELVRKFAAKDVRRRTRLALCRRCSSRRDVSRATDSVKFGPVVRTAKPPMAAKGAMPAPAIDAALDASASSGNMRTAPWQRGAAAPVRGLTLNSTRPQACLCPPVDPVQFPEARFSAVTGPAHQRRSVKAVRALRSNSQRSLYALRAPSGYTDPWHRTARSRPDWDKQSAKPRNGETATGREPLVHTSVSLLLVILALESSTRRAFGRQFWR